MAPLHIAVEKNNVEIVQLLLNNPKLNVNLFCERSQNGIHSTETALHIAVENENLQIIELLLLNDKIDINLACKIERGNKTCEVDYICDNKTALHSSVQKRNIEIVKLLLQNKNIDVNFPMISTFKSMSSDFLSNSKHESKREKTALHLAIDKNEIEIAKLLLSNENTDVNCSIKFTSSGSENNEDIKYNCAIEQETPALYFAVDENRIEIVRLLLANVKIDVNLPSKNKIDSSDKRYSRCDEVAPLHNAIKNKRIEIIQLLLENERINVNMPIKSCNESESNKTPLHLAVIAGKIEIIKLLLQHKNINTNATDFFSKKPVDYSVNDEIKKLF